MPLALVCVYSSTLRDTTRLDSVFDYVETVCSQQFPDVVVTKQLKDEFTPEYLAAIKYSGRPCHVTFVRTDEQDEVTSVNVFRGTVVSPGYLLDFVQEMYTL